MKKPTPPIYTQAEMNDAIANAVDDARSDELELRFAREMALNKAIEFGMTNKPGLIGNNPIAVTAGEVIAIANRFFMFLRGEGEAHADFMQHRHHHEPFWACEESTALLRNNGGAAAQMSASDNAGNQQASTPNVGGQAAADYAGVNVDASSRDEIVVDVSREDVKAFLDHLYNDEAFEHFAAACLQDAVKTDTGFLHFDVKVIPPEEVCEKDAESAEPQGDDRTLTVAEAIEAVNSWAIPSRAIPRASLADHIRAKADGRI